MQAPLAALMLALALATACHRVEAQVRSALASAQSEADTIDGIARLLAQGSFKLRDSAGDVIGVRQREGQPLADIAEQAIVDRLRAAKLTPAQAATLWSVFADEDNAAMATLPIVEALIVACTTPKSREELWSQLAGLARSIVRETRAGDSRKHRREASLLGLFERHRPTLLPLITDLAETQSSSDDMMHLMTASRVFGRDLDDSVATVSQRIPAALARRIEQERQREKGGAVPWEEVAFENLMRWRDARLVPGAKDAPRTLAALDAAGEAFVTIFNSLHALNDWYRVQMLRKLGPVELFNMVVGGERELYRLGTSGYRGFLHPVILKGIKQAGSFEAFLERATPRWLGDEAVRASARRGIVFLRVASSFGLVDSVLETVRDRRRLIADAIRSLGDPASFEANSAVVIDILTRQTSSAAALAFRRALLDQLYERYRAEAGTSHDTRVSDDDPHARLRSVYGSMLSVYQSVAGDHTDPTIDAAFPLDRSRFDIPFERLFSPDGKGGWVHRIFMRMDEDDDAVQTYDSFRTLIASRGGGVREGRHFDLFSLSPRGSASPLAPGAGRTIEIYANKPSAIGVQQGIGAIEGVLRGQRVETVIGRGHTGIIEPLQTAAKNVLGDRIREVAAVIVGACGGEASLRELISTFGYVPLVSTRSTGRQVINNAITEVYVSSLLKLAPGDRLSMTGVLDRALARFMHGATDPELRADASLYQVNMAAVLAALLFETHVRRHIEPERYSTLYSSETR